MVKAYELIQQLEDKHWKTIKSEEIKKIISATAGLYIEAVATVPHSTRGNNVTIKVEAINRSTAKINLTSIAIESIGISKPLNTKLENNISSKFEYEGTIPANLEYTNPYWLNAPGTLGMYTVTQQNLIGTPETKSKINALFNLNIEGATIPFEKNVVYKTNDPVKGEVYKPFEIIPYISASL